MQNNLFNSRVLTVTIPQSQIHQILLFRSWPLQSYKTTQLNHSYKLWKNCLKKFQLSLFTIMWRLCGWFIRVFMAEEGRGWGWNCPCTKCIESLLTETSAVFSDNRVMNVQYCLFLKVTSLWFLEFGFSTRCSLPRTGCYFLEEKTTKIFDVELYSNRKRYQKISRFRTPSMASEASKMFGK